MRFKRAAQAVFLLLALGLLFPAPSARAESAETQEPSARGDVLVIYPQEADRLTGEDSLSAIAQVLFSLRFSADFVEAGEARGLCGSYDRVIWCNTVLSDRMDPDLLSGFGGSLLALGQAAGLDAFGLRTDPGFSDSCMGVAVYTFDDAIPFSHSVPLLNAGTLAGAASTAGKLTAAGGSLPVSCGTGHLRYVALTDYTAPFARAVLTQEIAQWLWPYDSKMHTYTGHVVLDAVYPYYDPHRLQALADEMIELKMPFVISAMPIYAHSDYPAMTEFCEVLRYAQASGGAVILHAPIIQNGIDAEELASQLTVATCNYLDQKVYPLALEIPSEWLFREDLFPILRRYRTLFLSDLDAFSSHSPKEYSLWDYYQMGSQQIVPAIRLDENGISHLGRCATAVYLDLAMTEDSGIRQSIDAVRGSPLPMQSLWGMEQAVYVNDGYFLTWDRDTLLVNDEQRFNVFSPTVSDGQFDYRRNEYYRFVANLQNQNHFLIVTSFFVLILFLMLAFRSRRQMHRRFLGRKTDPAGRDTHVSS